MLEMIYSIESPALGIEVIIGKEVKRRVGNLFIENRRVIPARL
jgi:hypothetical protein